MSIRFQADNDLKFRIVKAVRRREPAIDFAPAQEADLESVGDPELLDWAAREDRVLVSHDRRTMLEHFRAHLAAGKSSPGVLISPLELRDQAHYLPSLSRHRFNR